MNSKQNQELIEKLLERDILPSKELLEKEVDETLLEKIEHESDLLVINNDYVSILQEKTTLVDWYEFDRSRVDLEKERDDDLYQSQLQQALISQNTTSGSLPANVIEKPTSLELELENPHSEFEIQIPVAESQEEVGLTTDSLPPIQSPSSALTIVLSYQNIPHKYEPKDFARFFLTRYKYIESLLRTRSELVGTLSINRVLQKKEKEDVAVIGIIHEIAQTSKGNILITLEDPTGMIRVVFTQNNKDLFALAQDLVVDEVIGVSGVVGDKIIFGQNIIWPDIPASHELKKGPIEEHAVFLSDIHVGSTLFLEKEFTKFISWIQGKVGNEQQRHTASLVKYIFIAGDLVDGVGIYPSQQEELSIDTIEGQYEKFAQLIKQIPKDKHIIMCPGNHDAVHLAEPQPVFYQKFAPGIFDIQNVTLVTNPAIVNIGKTNDFEGFDVLLYHGYSFDYYVANVASIRANGGYHRSDLIMKFLLKRRHLAPSFKSTPYYPSHDEDPLLIKQIPDFFVTGHIHYCSVANYKGITMISGSCWQAKTSFQEKLGHEPQPARVPIVNLKTREIKVLRFG